MNKTILSVLALVLAAAAVYFLITMMPQTTPAPSTENAEYFQERLVTLGIADVGQPIEGFDAGLLMLAFPGFTGADFHMVATLGGHYEYRAGELEFVQDAGKPVSSADQMVVADGYATLLAKVSARLGMRADSKGAIDKIIERLNTSEIVEVGLDQAASVHGVTLMPLELVEDSRCPVNVQCVWAGTVKVRTKITAAGESEYVFEFLKPAVIKNAEITLVRVEPVPVAGTERSLSDYRFFFRVEKR